MLRKTHFSLISINDARRVATGVLSAGIVACLSILAVGCGETSDHKDSGKLVAFVSILPQEYFVKRIGGEFVDVHVLVGPGQSPETYEPTPKQMAALSEANVYFRIGVPFERYMASKITSTFKGLEVVDTQQGVNRRMMSGHGHAEETTGGSPDPHIWLSPELAKVQAKTIEEALSELSPEHAAEFRDNMVRFDHDLDSVKTEIDSILAPYRGESIYAFHPAYGYFADAFGLKQVAIEIEGKEPSAKELSRVIGEMQGASNHVIFVQPQFSNRTAKTIADAVHGEVMPLDPLAEGYLSNLVSMARTIATALRQGVGPGKTPASGGGHD